MIKTSILVLICVAPSWAQNFQSGGFFEDRTLFYPQSAPNDNGYVVNDALFRWEGSYKAASWLTFSSALDFRTDSHRQVEREWRFDVDDRSTQRPAFSLRQMNATIHKGKFTAEIGRQFIRWGKADILNPTDRFAPRDYLSNVVDADYLGVAAARLTVTAGSNTLDLVWQPWSTPSRIPLLNQRWTTVPEQFAGFGIVNGGARYPGGSQYGARWNHVGSEFEYSACFFDGFNNLPSLVEPSMRLSSRPFRSSASIRACVFTAATPRFRSPGSPSKGKPLTIPRRITTTTNSLSTWFRRSGR